MDLVNRDNFALVINVLIGNRNKFISVKDIQQILNDKIPEGEIETIVEYLYSNSFVSHVFMRIDGYEIDISTYKLKHESLLLLEKIIKYRLVEIFPKEMEPILKNIHKEFNNELFDNIDIIDFLDLFKLNTQKKLTFKKDCIALFAILISKYEKCHNKKIGAFADWYNKTFGGNYKENKAKKPIRKSEYLEIFDEFLKKNPPPSKNNPEK